MKSVINRRWMPLLLAAGFALIAANSLAEEHIASDEFGGLSTFPNSELLKMRGRNGEGTTTVTSLQNLQTTSAGNTVMAETITGGAVNMNDSAMQKFKGIANLVFTTGNTNTINAAVSVNINLEGSLP